MPINCDGEFHWVLTVISVKERCIRVYYFMSSSRNREQSCEIRKLVTMLPTYIQYSNFFEQKVPNDWSALESYKKKLKTDPFQVELFSGIAYQESDSLYVSPYFFLISFHLSKLFLSIS